MDKVLSAMEDAGLVEEGKFFSKGKKTYPHMLTRKVKERQWRSQSFPTRLETRLSIDRSIYAFVHLNPSHICCWATRGMTT